MILISSEDNRRINLNKWNLLYGDVERIIRYVSTNIEFEK